jgi:CheY-like chemotaxis protein
MPRRIVIIENAPEIIELYMDLFAQEGYTVVATFAEPVTDPHVIEHHHPDIVIMDWLFGDKGTGLRTLELLTTYPPTADIPIIVCTTLRTLNEADSIFAQHGVRLLHKPFVINDLVALIKEVVV